MNKSVRWWLISDEDVKIIRESLLSPEHEANDFNCPHPGDHLDREGCSRCEAVELRRQALHALDSGLHKTDAIPDDWKEAELGLEVEEKEGGGE